MSCLVFIRSGGCYCLEWSSVSEKNKIFILPQALGMPQEAIVCYQRAVQTRPNAIAFGKCNYIAIDFRFI